MLKLIKKLFGIGFFNSKECKDTVAFWEQPHAVAVQSFPDESKVFITLMAGDHAFTMEDVPSEWRDLFDKGLVPEAYTWK